jgi:hypothetical protein
LLPAGLRFKLFNLLHLLLICIILIWLSAALRPQFGAGINTALICAFIFWLIELLIDIESGKYEYLPLEVWIDQDHYLNR